MLHHGSISGLRSAKTPVTLPYTAKFGLLRSLLTIYGTFSTGLESYDRDRRHQPNALDFLLFSIDILSHAYSTLSRLPLNSTANAPS